MVVQRSQPGHIALFEYPQKSSYQETSVVEPPHAQSGFDTETDPDG